MIKSMKIRVKDRNLKPYLLNKLFSTKHFENILLILIQNDYQQNEGKNFNLLTNGAVMRAVLTGNPGDKDKQQEIAYMREFYKDNDLMKSLIEVSKNLKTHNVVEQIKDVKKNYAGFFTKIKNGDTSARPPKPKKLAKVNHMTLFVDSYKGYSFKRKNTLGINLGKKMKYTHVKHDAIVKVVGSLDDIRNVNVNYSNGEVYFIISYDYSKSCLPSEKVEKLATLDVGVENLASIYIEDETSKSLIVSGDGYKDYNSKFNRLLAMISSEIDFNRNLKDELKQGLDVDSEIAYLKRFRSFLYEKRNNFFYSEFHKLSKRTLEYLKLQGVTKLVISKDLADAKNSGESKMNKTSMQKFIQIPLMQFLKNLEDKAPKFGIEVVCTHEAYTSKTSSLSRDVNEVIDMIGSGEALDELANVFGGTRARRGLFVDNVMSKAVNADLNGARNMAKVYLGKAIKLKIPKLFKLCNPHKITCDGELLNLVKSVALG